VTGEPGTVDRWRRAFAADDGPPSPGAACPDPGRIWDAVHATLARDEAHAVVRHVADCPSCAAAWRLAMTDPARASGPGAGGPRARGGVGRGVAVAALAAAAALAVLVWLGAPERRSALPAAEFRDTAPAGIASLIPDGTVLPRAAPVLRWTAAGPDARYRVELSLDDLTPLAVEHALVEPAWEIPAAVLARVPPGSTIVWRVEARLADGGTVTSPAFVHRVE